MPSPSEPPRRPGVLLAQSDSRADLHAVFLVLALAALLLLPPLGQRVISTSHEARFAVLAQDMLRHQAWLEARVGGEVYRTKPPLFPWSIAALASLRGRVTEATAQAPAALAALSTVLLTFLLGRALFGRRAGLWAGLILVTSYDFFAHSQVILPDMLVVVFFAAAASAFWRAASGPPRRGAMAGFYAALALGVFAKGPVGLLPLLVAAAWLWSEAGPRGLGRLWSLLGLVLFAAVTLGWLGPFLVHGTRSFAQSVFWQDWFAWFVGLPFPKHWPAFAVESVLGLMPWTFVLPLALAAAVRAWRIPSTRFVLLWLAIPFVLIALSNNPRARYLLPIHPAAALLIAWWADTQGATRTLLGRALGWASLAGAAGAIALLLRVRLSPGILATAPAWAAPVLILGVAGVGAALFGGLRAGRPALLVGAVAGCTAVMLAFGMWLYSDWVNRTLDFPRVAETLARHAGSQAPVAYLTRRFFQVDFYAGRELRQLRTVQEFNAWMARPERPVALVNGRNWDFIAPHRSPHLRVLERVPVGEEELLIVSDGRPPGASEGGAAGVPSGR